QHEIDVARHQLMRNGVELISATASFCGPETVQLDFMDGSTARKVTAHKIVIAAGTDTTRDPQIPLDGKHVFTSDDVLKLDRLPRTLSVVGAGVIACEYASIFAALGVRVTLIDKRNRLLRFVDEEIIDTLCYHLRENRVPLSLGESVERIDVAEDSAGLCSEHGISAHSTTALLPIGIYSVTEISIVCKTEEELTHAGIAYEVSKARYREIARGQIIGDTTGLLKLIFHAETRELLGVHII